MEGLLKPEIAGEYSEKHPMYAGVWMERVSSGDQVEIGWSNYLAEEDTDVKIETDFDYFEQALERFTPENIEKGFVDSEQSLREYFKELPRNIDLRTFYTVFCVQKKVAELLKTGETDLLERKKLYLADKEKLTKLSETIGKTACAERALFGKYLLQKLGIESAFVAGAVVSDENLGENALNEAHSYIVIRDPKVEGGKTLIYDIARPFTEMNLPALYETQIPVDHETFKDKRNALVESTTAYLNRNYIGFDKQYFGIGSPELYVGEKQVLRPDQTEP
ncbi:MAG: hypothetical protein KGI41_02075 [Patescibacteria group bacterium]|nr:hypothetical protein [Patescibacteria group bacterium]MDE1966004.1 hypothetical protein [Patescibacteria group bacterium]